LWWNWRGGRSSDGKRAQRRIAFKQNAAWWRVDIVELTLRHRPDKRSDRTSAQQQCDWQNDIQDVHTFPLKALDTIELATTDKDDSGINSAAMSG
jgi:hypothetical protein